jgi:hypothetical protein
MERIAKGNAPVSVSHKSVVVNSGSTEAGVPVPPFIMGDDEASIVKMK